MKVLVDGYNLDLETGTGVATYARNLTYCAHELGHEIHVLYGTRSAPGHKLLREIAFFDAHVGSPDWFTIAWQRLEEVLTFRMSPKPRAVPITGQVITKQFRSRLPYFDQLWNVPGLFGRSHRHFYVYRRRLNVRMPLLDRVNIAHWTYPLPIKLAGAKNIYTIHDLVPLRLPYTTLDVKRFYFRMTRKLARQADHIVTVSENSRKDIISLLGVPEDRVTNTYQAVDIPEKYAGKPEDVVRREVEGTFNLKYKGYMLFFGAIEPKKNIGRLIEAYLGSQIETPLIIVGKRAWKSDQEFRLLNDDVVRFLETKEAFTLTRHRIQYVDYAPFPLLVSLIRGAKAALFPSLYEGFGLPALEAMQLGTPVLTSTEGSMPEVAGDAALLVDPYDSREIAEGIRALDSDAGLRAELSEKGRRRAALFSHEKYRTRLDDLYQTVMR